MEAVRIGFLPNKRETTDLWAVLSFSAVASSLAQVVFMPSGEASMRFIAPNISVLLSVTSAVLRDSFNCFKIAASDLVNLGKGGTVFTTIFYLSINSTIFASNPA